jgi:hypothetical protein
MPKPPKRTKPTKTKIKSWLKAHGHRAERVDALSLNSDEQITAALVFVHGVTAEQYAAGRR